MVAQEDDDITPVIIVSTEKAALPRRYRMSAWIDERTKKAAQ